MKQYAGHGTHLEMVGEILQSMISLPPQQVSPGSIGSPTAGFDVIVFGDVVVITSYPRLRERELTSSSQISSVCAPNMRRSERRTSCKGDFGTLLCKAALIPKQALIGISALGSSTVLPQRRLRPRPTVGTSGCLAGLRPERELYRL
jgi:hypothetical protein